MSVRKSTSPKYMRTQYYRNNPFVWLENSDPNFGTIQKTRKSSKKSLRSINKFNQDKINQKNISSVAYKSISSTTGRYSKDIKYYMTNQPSSTTSNTYNNSKNYQISGYKPLTDTESVSNDFVSQNDETNEIIWSLKALNKRSTDTRNSPKSSFAPSYESKTIVSYAEKQQYLSLTANVTKETDSNATKEDISELWKAIHYQDKTINKLISENSILNNKLKEAESKLNGKIKDVNRNVSGISSNFEHLLPIIKEINEKYKSVSQINNKSRSPLRNKPSMKSSKKLSNSDYNKGHSKQITSWKLNEVRPDSDQVTVLNYNLCQNIYPSDSELFSISKKKASKRPLYFQSTLSSHSKIEKLSLLKKKSRSEWGSIHQTPASKSKLVNKLSSPNNEIEQELPQMSKLFSSAKENRHLKSNIKQWRLDLSDVNCLMPSKRLTYIENERNENNIVKSSTFIMSDKTNNLDKYTPCTSRNKAQISGLADENSNRKTITRNRKSWFD